VVDGAPVEAAGAVVDRDEAQVTIAGLDGT
jgi:hypothetical protein